MNNNRLGRSSHSTNGKVHKFLAGTMQNCNYSGQIRPVTARSTVNVDEVTPANACGRCFDLNQETATVQEQAVQFLGLNAASHHEEKEMATASTPDASTITLTLELTKAELAEVAEALVFALADADLDHSTTSTVEKVRSAIYRTQAA